MGKNWIYWATNHLCVDSPEFFNSVTEGNDLCWTNKRAVKEKQNCLMEDKELLEQ